MARHVRGFDLEAGSAHLAKRDRKLGRWIELARARGDLNPALPPEVVLYTLFARACDPVLEFLKMGEQHTDEQILNLVMSTCFDGLNAR